MVHFKLTAALYRETLADLLRPHPFAKERNGFLLGRTSDLGCGRILVLLAQYKAIPDGHYVQDESVGARIGREAITSAMQDVYEGRPVRLGIFHVHLHLHKGQPGMSGIDRHELPALLPGFQSVGRDATHGVIILSSDHASAWIHRTGGDLVRASSISIIGSPISVFVDDRRAA